MNSYVELILDDQILKLEEIAETLGVNLEFELQIDSQSTIKRLVFDGQRASLTR